MKKQLLKSMAFGSIMLFSVVSLAQNNGSLLPSQEAERCSFSSRHEHLMQTDPSYAQKRMQEEAHIQQFIQNPNLDKVAYVIPVVVHVIHKGEAVGTGTNISDAQIISAINNMNDAYSNTSTAFSTYTGVNTNIQFCLAQRDPNGNPTTGIVRVNGTSASGYSAGGIGTGGATETTVKALSKWDNTKYYNFWIVSEIDNNGGGAGTQGYAYFPGAGPSVDGAVMLYNAFGYDPDGSLGYNLKSYTNRNTTPVHEIGHALNLYHTFEGDGSGSTCPAAGNNCGSGVGDCVADTPPHKRSNSDCLVNTVDATCNNVDRDLYIHNFMDYSSDVCTSEFTSGQATRMVATLTGAGLRASLTVSDGCNPANNNYDASITSIVAPISSYCQTNFAPQVTLRNFGLTTLTSVTINYNIDGGANQVYNWTGSLATGASEVVTLTNISTTVATHTFNASTSTPNGQVDEYQPNDANSVSFTITTSSAIPFVQDFEGTFPPTGWTNTSNDGTDGSAWDVDGIKQLEKRAVAMESDGTAGNAMAINGYAYSTSTGDRYDVMVSPSINLSTATAPSLQFQVSHAYYNTTVNTEGLKVYVSNDCGVNFTAVYDKSAATLATNGQSTGSWAPTAVGHWRQETIDLSAYAGDVITVKFETHSDYGNNLYIDKINLFDNCVAPVVTQQPSNTTICSGSNTSYSVTNTGGGTFQWQVSTNGGLNFNNISDNALYSGTGTATLNLTNVSTGSSTNQFRCVITNACGSVNSNAAIITVNATPAAPTISAGSATTFCSGGSVVLTSTAGSGNTWSNSASTQSITVSTSGTFTVIQTVSGCASASSNSITVTVNPTPSIASGTVVNPSTCSGMDGSVQITGSGTGNLTWSGTASGSMTGVTLPITIPGLGAGSYAFVFDNGCTSNTVNATLTDPGAPATPTISAGSSTTFCTGGSVVLTSSSATGNMWSTGATTQSITVSSAGNYSVTVTQAGCSATSTMTTVTVNAIPSAPTISAGSATTFCAGGSVVLTSTAGSGNTWSNAANTQSITVSTSGTFTVTQTMNGCTSPASNSITVTVNPLPSIASGTVTNPSTCNGTDGSIQISGSGTGNLTWTGTASGSMMGVTLPTTVSGLGAGSYAFTFDNGCTSNAVNASLSDPGVSTPTISADGPLTICVGEDVVLTSSSASGNAWSTTETTQSITVTTSGTYSVTVTQAGCTATSSTVTVVVNSSAPTPPVLTTSGSLTFCQGGSVDLTSDQTSGNTWSTGAQTQSITVTTAGDYYVTIGTGNCVASSDTVTVVVNPNPTVTLGAFNDMCNTASSFNLNGGSPAGGSYTVNGSAATSFDPSSANIGTNTIVYTFTDGNNCSGSATQTITVNDCSSVDENGKTAITLYPNPASNVIYIKGLLDNNVKVVKLYDQSGRLVTTMKGDFEKGISVVGLSNGLYNVEITTEKFVTNQRISVVK